MSSLVKYSALLGGTFLSIAMASSAVLSSVTVTDNHEEKAEKGITKIGEARNCVRDIRSGSTLVINDKTVQFTARDGKIYRNTLITTCPIIRNSDRFAFQQRSQNRLCKGDSISSLETIGDRLETFGRCALGEFQQIEKKSDK